MRKWLIAASVLFALIVAAALAFAITFDPSGYKDRVETAALRATGRTLTIAGPIHLAWGLTPALDMEDVSLANMPGGTRPAMATVARAELRIRLLPLLVGQINIASVRLVRPDILLETDQSGRGNWIADRPVQTSTSAGVSVPRPSRTLVERLEIETGRVTWHDGSTGRTALADVPHVVITATDGPVQLQATATLNGLPSNLAATLGSVAQLTSGTGSFPVTGRAALGSATVALNGAWDPLARALTGRVEMAVPDAQQIAAAWQIRGVPTLQDLHVSADLPGGGGPPDNISIQIGASDLSSILPDLQLVRLALSWPAGQPARLTAQGTLSGAPWQLSTGLAATGQAVALRGLQLTAGPGDLAGDLALTRNPRLAIRGTLVSNRIDIDALPALRPPPASVTSPPITADPAAPHDAKLFSDAPLPWPSLRSADADLQWTIGSLTLNRVTVPNVTSHLQLADGHLQLDPVSIQAPGSRIDASFSADAGSSAITLAAHSAGFNLGALSSGPNQANAVAELDVELHATGATPHALAASLTGHAGLAMVDATVPNALLGTLFGRVLQSAGVGFDQAGTSRLRCFAARADASAGLVTLATVKLDATRLGLDGSGVANLADETLALHLRPLLRMGGTGVSAPVQVEGSLRHPVVTLEPASGRVGVTIGGLSGPADDCAAALSAARDGHNGRLPTPAAATKPPKPADLLRTLLH